MPRRRRDRVGKKNSYREHKTSSKELIRLIEWQGDLCCGYGYKRSLYVKSDFNDLKIKDQEDAENGYFMCEQHSLKEGFYILKNAVTLLRILNLKQNNFHIKGFNEIMLVRAIYMDLFEIIDNSLRKLAIPEKYLNIWLLRKIGKKEYIGRVNGTWNLHDTRK